jgi:hypothetical protein
MLSFAERRVSSFVQRDLWDGDDLFQPQPKLSKRNGKPDSRGVTSCLGGGRDTAWKRTTFVRKLCCGCYCGTCLVSQTMSPKEGGVYDYLEPALEM